MSIKLSSSAFEFDRALSRAVYGNWVCAKSGIDAPSTGGVRLLPGTTVPSETRHVGDFQAPKPMAGAVRVPPWRPPV